MKREIAAYFKKLRRVLLLFAACEALTAVVYGLYGLPWGPALYTVLLTGALALGAAGAGFFPFRRRLRQVRHLRREADFHLGPLPGADDDLEQAYHDVARALEERCKRIQAASRSGLTEANRYYTLWSHQIKTPLAAMRLLLQEPRTDKQALMKALYQTEQYVEMALQYQRLQGGSPDLVLQEYDLARVVRQAVKKTATLFIHKKISVELAPMACGVITDEKWLVFVIEQLLTNAVKYTAAGGRVSIYPAEGAPSALVIEDTGIGILAQDLPRVFDWGYTGCNGRADKRATGIGLALCKQVMDLLGHGITIQSRVGAGTKVTLELGRRRLEMD